MASCGLTKAGRPDFVPDVAPGLADVVLRAAGGCLLAAVFDDDFCFPELPEEPFFFSGACAAISSIVRPVETEVSHAVMSLSGSTSSSFSLIISQFSRFSPLRGFMRTSANRPFRRSPSRLSLSMPSSRPLRGSSTAS